ncbi:unnamed protein product [Polarella glacialis]|uniref:Uncharacterized protein n=1 Tax=Polarella glacialis TaxID=89957 RepID=A0A813GBX2_POLGL|nr:unnamed protein product [Polarella glacialis]CAE8667722.1 unnamed protein product [Polarella glacialis]
MTKGPILGPGAAFGNHCTSEPWKAAFLRQGLVEDGVTECDLDFAQRVLDACLQEPAFIRALIAEAAARADPPEVNEMDIAFHTDGPCVPHEVAEAADAADEELAESWVLMEAQGNPSVASHLSVLDDQNCKNLAGHPGSV